MANYRGAVIEGMAVHSRDGEVLGRVIHCGAETFLVRGGHHRARSAVRYSEIASIRGGVISLAREDTPEDMPRV